MIYPVMIYPPKSLVRTMLAAIDRANVILARSARTAGLNPTLAKELANIEPAQMARIVKGMSK